MNTGNRNYKIKKSMNEKNTVITDWSFMRNLSVF
jgi:hypothetical protein